MRNAFPAAILVLAAVFCLPGKPLAEDEGMEDVKKKIEILTEEVERLKLGGAAEPKYESFSGLGPAASKVYGIGRGISLGGYGEAFFSQYQAASKKDLADAQRFVLYLGNKFSDRIVMNAELEFEHAGIGNAASKESEVYVEFMYLDFLINPAFNVRTGLLLMPIGLTNEYHEPTVYNSVLRPDIETKIIPTTWRELGAMAYGRAGDLEYKAGVFNGLRADRLRGDDFIRASRQQGAKANADSAAALLNLNYYLAPGLAVGGTYYIGRAEEGAGGSQKAISEKEGTISLWELHGEYRYMGLQLKGLYTEGSVEGNSALESSSGVPKKVRGWYAEAGYDVMPHVRPASLMSLTPFARYEDYNTHEEVFTGTPDRTLERTVTTVGVSYKPMPQVVIKADYQWRDSASGLPEGKGAGLDENKIDQFNFGVGFIF